MRSVTAIAVLLGLTGCVVTPPPPRIAAPPALITHRLDDPALAQSLAKFDLPALHDARVTIDQATLVALQFNPALAAAIAHAQSDSAAAKFAAERANPLLSFTPDRVISGAAGAVPWTAALTLALPLLYPGQQAARERSRDATIAAVRFDLARSIWQSRSDTVAAFRALLLAEQAALLARQIEAVDQARLASSDRLFAARQIGGAERALIRDAAARSALRTPLRQGALATAGQQLLVALGLPPGTAVEPQWGPEPQSDGWQTPPSAAMIDGLIDAAMFNRLDVQAALARLRVAEEMLAQTEAGRHPDIAINPGYSFDQGQHRLQLGVDLTIPVFHGPAAKLAAARTARNAAKADVEAVQARVIAEISAAHSGYASAYAIWAAYVPILAVAQGDIRRAENALNAGSGDRPTVLEAQSRYLQNRIDQLDALAQLHIALGQLEAASERPIWPESRLAAHAIAGRN